MDRLSILSNLWDASLDGVQIDQLVGNINSTHRNSVLKWLLESLDLLKIEERVFFATVMIADRYCTQAASRRRLEGSELQLVILSSLCCCLKVVESSLDLSVKAFLEHVSGGHVDPKDIFATEAKILQTLNFNVFSPSPSVYIDSFYFALHKGVNSQFSETGPLEQSGLQSIDLSPSMAKHKALSLFLLYLAVLDVNYLHSIPPPVLVSSCILTSAYALSDECTAISDIENIADVLVQSEWLPKKQDISLLISRHLRYWKRSLGESSDASEAIVRMFNTRERFHVSRISPNVRMDNVDVSGG